MMMRAGTRHNLSPFPVRLATHFAFAIDGTFLSYQDLLGIKWVTELFSGDSHGPLWFIKPLSSFLAVRIFEQGRQAPKLHETQELQMLPE